MFSLAALLILSFEDIDKKEIPLYMLLPCILIILLEGIYVNKGLSFYASILVVLIFISAIILKNIGGADALVFAAFAMGYGVECLIITGVTAYVFLLFYQIFSERNYVHETAFIPFITTGFLLFLFAFKGFTYS